MKNVSMTGVGIAVFAIMWALRYFGFDLDQATVTETVGNLVQITSTVMILVGQFRRKDLTMGVFRK